MYYLEYLLNVSLFLVLIWICMFLVTLAHEMGHAIMYRIFFKENNWHITIGKGQPFINLKKFTIRAVPFGGVCKCTYNNKVNKFEDIMVSLGGPLANILSIAILYFLLNIVKANEPTLGQQNLLWVLNFIFLTNVYQFAFSVIPMKLSFWPFNGYTSDGMRILIKARVKSNV